MTGTRERGDVPPLHTRSPTVVDAVSDSFDSSAPLSMPLRTPLRGSSGGAGGSAGGGSFVGTFAGGGGRESGGPGAYSTEDMEGEDWPARFFNHALAGAAAASAAFASSDGSVLVPRPPPVGGSNPEQKAAFMNAVIQSLFQQQQQRQQHAGTFALGSSSAQNENGGFARVDTGVCVPVRAFLCMRAGVSAHVCVQAYTVHVYVLVHASVLPRVRVCVCVHACVRAYVRACMHGCECALSVCASARGR
jgi:hypothetical protein